MIHCSKKVLAAGLVVLIAAAVGCSGKEDRALKHRERAHAYLASGDLEKARVEFKYVLQMDPKNIDALQGQAEVHEKLEKWREAAGLYQRIVELDDTHVTARERLARLMLLGGAFDRALDLADAVLAMKSDSTIGLTVKGAVLARNGQLEAAETLINKARYAAPDNLDATMLQSSLLAQQGRRNEAVHVLEEGLRHHPDNAGIITVLAQIHADMGNQRQAIELLQRLVESHPADLGFRQQFAAYRAHFGDKDGAEQVLREGVRLASEQTGAKMLLVDFLLKTRGSEMALTELRKFIAENGNDVELRLTLAKILDFSGDRAAATKELESIIGSSAASPDILKARLELARFAASDANSKEARRLVDEVLKENPRDNDGLLLRGKLALLENDMPRAIADLRAVLHDQPASVDVLTLLGRAHLANREHELAKEMFDKAIARATAPTPLRFEIASLYVQSGMADDALPLLRNVTGDEVPNLAALELLFRAEVLSRDIAGARATAQRVRDLQPESGLGDFLMGQADVAGGDHITAIRHFRSALVKSPESLETLSALVKSRLALQQHKEAVNEVSAFLKDRPQHHAALNILGEIYLIQQRHKDAENVLRRAIVAHPAGVAAYRNLAVAHVQMKDIDGAVKVLQEGMASADRGETLAVDLATLMENAGRIDDAVGVYEQVLSKQPGSQVFSNNLAMVLVTHRSDPANLARANKLIEVLRGTSDPAYLDTMGWVYYSMGELDRALPLLLQAAAAAPGQPLVQYHLGMVQYKKGDLAAARTNLQGALDRNVAFAGRDVARATLNQIAAGG